MVGWSRICGERMFSFGIDKSLQNLLVQTERDMQSGLTLKTIDLI